MTQITLDLDIPTENYTDKYLPYGVTVEDIVAKVSPTGYTAVAIIKLNTGFEMVGSAQFDTDITNPTDLQINYLKIAAVKNAYEKICDIENQDPQVLHLFLSLL